MYWRNSVGRTKESTVCFHPTDVALNYKNCWGEDHKDAKILILGTDPTVPDRRLERFTIFL